MISHSKSPADRIGLRIPIILMVLAATAIPIEFRPLGHVTLEFGIDWVDALENIAGFVPVGIVLGGLGPVRGVIVAALMSAFAETSQLVMMHRDPSFIDLATNIMGSMLGVFVRSRWKIQSIDLPIRRWTAPVAVILALLLVLRVWATSGEPLNPRGTTAPGILEAWWKLDDTQGRVAADSSGRGHTGAFHNEPNRVAGRTGGAAKLDGTRDYIDFGRSSAFRMTGSMTISAWINSSSFPADDAAIVSTLNGSELGYQLDTTIDEGPRTIGFKLGDSCGELMARYGATPLALNTWYHVAGVYDAAARTLNVYLNGKPDNGFLKGTVTGTQRASRTPLRVGKRSDLEKFEFAGFIDDVRIYSFALSQDQVLADMNGTAIHREAAHLPNAVVSSPCPGTSDQDDARLPGAAASFGVLVAIAAVGLWRKAGPLPCLVASLAAGLLFLPATSPTLPPISRLTMPLVSLAGGASVAFSVRRSSRIERGADEDHP